MKALCLSPHPDDVELSMFGTIAKQEHIDFDVFTCSIGGRWDENSSEARLQESMLFWNKSALGNVSLRDSFIKGLPITAASRPFVTDRDEGQWVFDLEFLLDIKSYDMIFTPPIQDTHFEHALLARVGRALIRKNPISLYEYKTISALPEWQPNYFVSLSYSLYDKKVTLLAEFASQYGKPYFAEEFLDSLHTNTLCLKQGIRRCEQYRQIWSIA